MNSGLWFDYGFLTPANKVEQTDTIENITFATLLADGNYVEKL